jgi:iron complex outermembrane receptor protein
MRFIKQTAILAAFTAIQLPAYAQQTNTGVISGTILLNDATPAQNVPVYLDGQAGDVRTDAEGRFTIDHVSAGKHKLRVALDGYRAVTREVDVTPGNTGSTQLELELNQRQLEEVTVRSGSAYKSNVPSSSLRLNEPLQEIPQSIQIITNKVLADQQVTTLSDGLIRNVSGLTRLEHWADIYTRVNMRGGRAAAFRNGMNVTSSWGPLTEDMSFVDHVEFVKGPAGFMMSNGDPSGLYNVVTKRPTGQTRGEAGLMMGSYDFYRATVDLDGKLDKQGKVLYRLNLMDQAKGSFRPYEYNDRYSIAPVITYKIDDKTTLTAEYVLQHMKTSNVGSFYAFSTQGYATLPRNFTMADPGLVPSIINDHSATVNLTHQFNADWKLTAQAAYYNYQAKGESMWPGYVDSLGNIIRSVSIWDASNIMKFGQVFVNGNFQTGIVKHRVLGGLDLGTKEYMADWNQSHNLDSAGAYFNVYNPSYGAPANGYPDFDRSRDLRQRAGQYAVLSQRYTGLYLQDELGFFDNRARLTLAGRYTTVQDNSYGIITEGERFTPRVGLSVNATQSTAVYALFDQSFVPQTGIRRDGNKVLPVTGNNLEAGIKQDFFNGRWNAALSVYRILQNNQTSADPSNGPGESYVVQFGQTRTKGIELDIRGRILPGLSVVANYAYTDNVISETDTSEAMRSTLGNKVPGYATHVANAWLTYRVQSGVLKGLGVNGGFSFQGDRTTWSWGAPGEKSLPDYFRLDGGLSYERGKYTLTANIFNILDTYLYSGAYYAYIKAYYWQAEAGRNLRLGVNYRF